MKVLSGLLAVAILAANPVVAQTPEATTNTKPAVKSVLIKEGAAISAPKSSQYVSTSDGTFTSYFGGYGGNNLAYAISTNAPYMAFLTSTGGALPIAVGSLRVTPSYSDPANANLDVKGAVWIENETVRDAIRLLPGTTGGAHAIESNYGSGGGYLPLRISANSALYPNQLFLDTGGNLGLGGQPANRFDVYGPSNAYVDSRRVIGLWDTTSFASGVGSGIDFLGKYNAAGAFVQFASIKGVKETSGDGNGQGAFVISTSTAAGAPTERLRIDSVGNVGIGGAPLAGHKLDVVGASVDSYDRSTASVGYARHFIENDAGTGGIAFLLYGSAFGGTSPYGGLSYANLGTVTHNAPNGFVVGTTSVQPLLLVTGSAERLRIDATGNVGIGTTGNPAAKLDVRGDVLVSGNIAAKYQDLAEWVPAAEDLEPGTVVVLDADRANTVRPSRRAYDTAVAGVVSAMPGIALGERVEGAELIATTGRVRVHVDARRSAIRIGDLLVSSDRRGFAMRSEPVTIDGHLLHRPGTVIGKALEPLASGQGTILVLLTLQ